MAKKTFESIFHERSVIKFVCKECTEKSETLNGQNNVLIEENANLKNQLNEKEQMIQKLNEELQENRDLVQNLMDNKDEPDQIESDGTTQKVKNVLNVQNNNEDQIQDTLLEQIQKMISDEIEKVSNAMTTKCKKVRKFCTKRLDEIEENINGIKIQSNAKKQNPFRVNSSSEQTSEVTGIADEQNHDTHIMFSQNLLQPTTNDESANDVRAMHVSKFRLGTKIEVIVEHIMQNTTIVMPDEFKVEELSNPTSDFVSFKISTSREKYDEIKNIWWPRYIARDFRPKRMNSMRNRSTHEMNNAPYGTSNVKSNQHNRNNRNGITNNNGYRGPTTKPFNRNETHETPKRNGSGRGRGKPIDPKKPPRSTGPEKTPNPKDSAVVPPTEQQTQPTQTAQQPQPPQQIYVLPYQPQMFQQPILQQHQQSQPVFLVPPRQQQQIIHPMQHQLQPQLMHQL